MSCCPPIRRERCVHANLVSQGGAHVVHSWISIPGGSYLIGGSDADANPGDSEGPPRITTVDDFKIAATTVTNSEFARFVTLTGYRTEAERFGWSYVFHDLISPSAAKRTRKAPADAPWWRVVEGACWRWPGGRGSHLRGREEHPVVHVSWHDARAYCDWAGARLPTEREWEIAARGGLTGYRYPWGDELTPGGTHMCNIWQGEFPIRDDAEDGFHGTCPVRSFPANGYGLFEVAGNVWEWCDDWWEQERGDSGSNSDRQPGSEPAKVMRGGSFLCHESYCNRYRVAARSSNSPQSSGSNIGFRVVSSSKYPFSIDN